MYVLAIYFLYSNDATLVLGRVMFPLYERAQLPIVQTWQCASEVCVGLRFVSGSRVRVEISTRLPARLPGDCQLLILAWFRGKNFLSGSGPGPRASLSSSGLSIPAGNPGVPDMEQY